MESRLKTRRTSLRMTRNDLGLRSGVSAKSIQQYEDGLRKPSPGVLWNMAQALQVTVEWLSGDDDGMPAGVPPQPKSSLYDAARAALALSPADRAVLLRLLQSAHQLGA